MSVEFRQRKPGEYAKIAWKRKWLIVLPAIAVSTAVAWVVYRLPDVFESSTLIVVKPSTLPGIVPTVTEDSLTRQLTGIAQVVTSRSSLEPLIQKYELYKTERLRGEPMESIVNMVRSDIKVEVNTSRNDITNGFNITFRGRVPKITQAVCQELARKYIDQQTRESLGNVESAKRFFDNQVQQAKDELDAVEKQRLDFLIKNIGNLPSQAGSLIGQLGGYRDQQKTFLFEVGRLQDRRSALAGQLALLKQQNAQVREDVAKNTTDPKTTMAYSQLAVRKAQVDAELSRLKFELREKHPDVIAKQQESQQLKEQMDGMVAEWEDKIKTEQERLSKRPDLGIAGVEAEIKLIDGEIKREQAQLGEIEKAINAIISRVNEVPGAEVALGAIDRDYQTKKGVYDGMLAQQTRIALGADAQNQQQGESIQVIDAANLPSQPVAPKRARLVGLGLAFGLGLGVFFAVAFEIPRMLTVQTSEDARHYTGLPVLISIPQLLTPQEARAIPRRRRLLLAAGMVATVISIPLLALALRATHIFETFTTSGGA